MKKAIDIFSKRLDEIFEDKAPTKALILDAFLKANQSQLKPQEGERKRICDCSGNETGLHDEFCHRFRGEYSL